MLATILGIAVGVGFVVALVLILAFGPDSPSDDADAAGGAAASAAATPPTCSDGGAGCSGV